MDWGVVVDDRGVFEFVLIFRDQVSNGMFENVYSPIHGAIVYVAHTEPLKPANKDKDGTSPQPVDPDAMDVDRQLSQPAGTGSGASGSTQNWSGFSTKDIPHSPSDEDGDGDVDMERPLRKVNLQKQEGKHIKQEDLTPLRLHDIWLFDWYQACSLEARPVGGLRHIIMLNIAETHTLQVLTELAAGDNRRWGTWPGTPWLKEDNEPLIGSTLGQSVAKLIVQRPSLFGSQRDLYGGSVWWTPSGQGPGQNAQGTVSMMFTLNDPPMDLINQQWNEVMAGGQTQGGLLGDVGSQRRPGGSSTGEQSSQRRKLIWGQKL